MRIDKRFDLQGFIDDVDEETPKSVYVNLENVLPYAMAANRRGVVRVPVYRGIHDAQIQACIDKRAFAEREGGHPEFIDLRVYQSRATRGEAVSYPHITERDIRYYNTCKKILTRAGADVAPSYCGNYLVRIAPLGLLCHWDHPHIKLVVNTDDLSCVEVRTTTKPTKITGRLKNEIPQNKQRTLDFTGATKKIKKLEWGPLDVADLFKLVGALGSDTLDLDLGPHGELVASCRSVGSKGLLLPLPEEQ